MENNEDKYANLDLTKVYDYKDLPDKILSRPKSQKVLKNKRVIHIIHD
ncbi:hypothetical protein [Priestia endophytica]|nr:hypothetical protein [Priestia endophytica]